MKWLTNFSLVMRSNLTTLREQIEDPERMLHQLIIDMEEELDRVRSRVAEAVADEILMRKRADREAAGIEKWESRAASAMTRGDEASAKAAIERKLVASEQADRYNTEHERQRTEVEKLQQSVRELEDRIRQASQKKTLLTARIASAKTAQTINSAMERSHQKSAFAQFRRLEEKVERQEAISEAWDRMDGKDPDAAEVERNFEQEERAQQIQAEMDSLKRSIGED